MARKKVVLISGKPLCPMFKQWRTFCIKIAHCTEVRIEQKVELDKIQE